METATIRHSRSAGRRNYRTMSNATVISVDDTISLSSSFSGSTFKRTSHSSRTGSVGDGISRMKYGRNRRKGSYFPNENGGMVTEVPSARGNRRMSSYSLSSLAEVGVKIRRRRKSTLDSWGQKRTPGETQYFDRVSGSTPSVI